MALTGSVFLTLIAVVTTTGFVALVVLWPSLAGPRPGMIAARGGLLLSVNLLVLLTAATQLNAQFLFFADWTDLRGALGGNPTSTVLVRGAKARNAARIRVTGPGTVRAGVVLPPLPRGVSASGVVSYKITGSSSGITGTVVVQLPPGYTDPRNASVRYPVLETFQGYPGTPRQWVDTMHLGTVMAQQVAARRMRPALIVSPQLEVPAGVDTECVNGSPGSPQLETWLSQDVPDWVARTFRVQTDRAAWATIGLSAGGWCAAMVTMLHPDRFSAAIVMGGYFRPQFGPLFRPYPPQSSLSSRYDLVGLARRASPPVALWLETSHSDPVSYGSSVALLKAAKPPLSVNAVVLQHAGHRIGLWQGLLPRSLSWLGTNIPGFGPL
jgi:S-formylglutathione hydrolase FrmB